MTNFRSITGLVLALMALSALFVPVVSAAEAGRFERCAVQSLDYGTVIVAYTMSYQPAIETAAAQCSFLISSGKYIAATNHVGLTDNPDFERVCLVEFSRDNSLNVFSSVYQPNSYYDAMSTCEVADDGTVLVTYG